MLSKLFEVLRLTRITFCVNRISRLWQIQRPHRYLAEYFVCMRIYLIYAKETTIHWRKVLIRIGTSNGIIT